MSLHRCIDRSRPRRTPQCLALCATLTILAIAVRAVHSDDGLTLPMTHSALPVAPVPAASRQLILVTAPAWESSTGSLGRYERDSPSSRWRQVGRRTPVVLGRSGLGWANGLQPQGMEGPTKREGDGRSPAGVFTLGELFGYGPLSPGFRTPYIHVLDSTRCIEDVRSRYYNQIVDSSGITAPDWSAADYMRRADDLYRLGVFVNANTRPVVPGAGSCILIHVWGGRQTPTVGCTAMDYSAVHDLATWLDPARNPVLVQLPAVQYLQLKPTWRLP